MESIKRVILIGTWGVLISSLLLAFFAPTAEAADSHVKVFIMNKSGYSIRVDTRVIDGEEAAQKGFGYFYFGPDESKRVLDITISEGTYRFGFHVDIHDKWYTKYVECKSNKITNVDLVVYGSGAEIFVDYSEKEKGFGGILWVCGTIFLILIIVISLGVGKSRKSRVRREAREKMAGARRKERREEAQRKRGVREAPRHPPSGAPMEGGAPAVRPTSPPSEQIKQFDVYYSPSRRLRFLKSDRGPLIIGDKNITFFGSKKRLVLTDISAVTKQRALGIEGRVNMKFVSLDARLEDGSFKKMFFMPYIKLKSRSAFLQRHKEITDEIYNVLSQWKLKAGAPPTVKSAPSPERVTGTELAPERMRIKCPGCETIFEVTLKERPFEMVCPRCGRKGVMK